jgi:hypothetical protein
VDIEEIVNASWSLFRHHGAAAIKLSEISTLPPALSAKDLLVGRTQLLNVRRLRRICHHPVGSHEDSVLESISDAQYWLHWDGELDHRNNCAVDWAADLESDIDQDNVIEDPECPELQDVTATPNVPRLIGSIWKSKRQAEKMFQTVNTIEMSSNTEVKKCRTECVNVSQPTLCILTKGSSWRCIIGKC